jgi:pimeloyl-ACP methyl ester carboxylesterase
MNRRQFVTATGMMAGASVVPASRGQSIQKSSRGLQDTPNNGKAVSIPVGTSTAFTTFTPVVLPVPQRPVDLELKVSAPASGRSLPIILLSHGHGNSNYLSSLNGYAPLANFYASHGFVTIQPTHLDSKALGLPQNGPEGPLFSRSRVQDMKQIMDKLDVIESTVLGLQGRLDHKRIAVIGHSAGGQTAAMLMGLRLTDPDNGEVSNLIDSRIKAGVLLSAPGNGGADLSPSALKFFRSYLKPDFSSMVTPTLVVYGDQDVDVEHHLTVRGPDWHADPYVLSGGPKCLLTLYGAKHNLGGISGFDAAEATDENPQRVAAVQRLTWAYLRSALYRDDSSWANARSAFAGMNDIGEIECKGEQSS